MTIRKAQNTASTGIQATIQIEREFRANDVLAYLFETISEADLPWWCESCSVGVPSGDSCPHCLRPDPDHG